MEGWPEYHGDVPEMVQPYFNYRDELVVFDGLIFKGERLLIHRFYNQKSWTSLMGLTWVWRPPLRDIRDIRDTVNPPRVFDQSVMLTSYWVWDQCDLFTHSSSSSFPPNPSSFRLFHAPTRTTSSGCFMLHRTVHALWNLYGNPYRNRAETEEETIP